MAALFMLNIYYIDETFDYGTIMNQNRMFDNRLGSELFAASITDASINTSLGMGLTDSAISNETKEKIKSSMCIIKYTSASWKKINDTLDEDNERLRKALVKSASFNDYINQNPDKISEIKSEHILSLATRFLGQDYIGQHNSFYNFGMAFNNAQREVVINKRQIIYG